MPIIFEMPSLSPTMEKGNLVTWCKNEGDEVAVGDLIAEIDTDKATMEVESIYKGVLAKILVPAGTHDVAVKTPIAIIRQKNDTDEDIANAIENISNMTKVKQNDEIVQSAKPIEPACNNFSESKHSEMKASPLAKRLANEYGVDIDKLSGSGPHGRIVKRDVLDARDTLHKSKHIELSDNSARYLDIPATSMQRLIAEKLTKVKQEVPHFYMSTKVDVTSLINLRIIAILSSNSLKTPSSKYQREGAVVIKIIWFSSYSLSKISMYLSNKFFMSLKLTEGIILTAPSR